MSIRKRVKKKINRDPRSLREIARKADVDPGNLSRYLNNKKNSIGTEALERVVEVLGLFY